MAQMSKTLATIEVNAPIDYRLEDAKLGNLFTPEAHAWMKKLEFKQPFPQARAGGAGTAVFP